MAQLAGTARWRRGRRTPGGYGWHHCDESPVAPWVWVTTLKTLSQDTLTPAPKTRNFKIRMADAPQENKEHDK